MSSYESMAYDLMRTQINNAAFVIGKWQERAKREGNGQLLEAVNEIARQLNLDEEER